MLYEFRRINNYVTKELILGGVSEDCCFELPSAVGEFDVHHLKHIIWRDRTRMRDAFLVEQSRDLLTHVPGCSIFLA